MVDQTLKYSIGELVDPKLMAPSLSYTAGGASDSVTWTGYSINLNGFSTYSRPASADVFLAYDLTLASGKTFALTWDVQEGPDGTNWSDYATEAYAVIATGPSGGGRVTGVTRLSAANQNANAPSGTAGINLAGCRAYLRANVVPHLSATGTDTAVMVTIAEFAGFDTLVAPRT